MVALKDSKRGGEQDRTISLPLKGRVPAIRMKTKVLHILNHIEEYLAGGLLLIMVSIAFINVVSRFTFKFSIAYMEELEIYLYVWLVLLGSAIAFKKWSHLSVALLVEKMPKPMQKVIEVFIALFSISFFIVLLYFGVEQMQDEILLRVSTTSMGVPMWWFTLGLPIGCLMIILRIIQRTFHYIKGGDREDELQ